MGLFVSMEGPDGSGKTLQMDLLEERLRKEGYDVLRSREPEDAFGVAPGFYEAEDGLHIYVKEARLDNPFRVV